MAASYAVQNRYGLNRLSIANCSLTVVQVRADGRMKLVAFADSGHVPWSMTTYPGVTAEQ